MRTGNKNLLRVGAPFAALMVSAYFGLTYATEIRYWVRRNKKLFALNAPDDEGKRSPLSSKTLEEIYKEEIADKSFEEWQNIRAPRPWEPETLRVNEENARKLRQQQTSKVLNKIEERAQAAAAPSTTTNSLKQDS